MILITRPLKSSYKTLDKIEAIGLKGKVCPLLNIDFDLSALRQIELNKFDIIIITSPNVSEAFKKLQLAFINSILAVGERNAMSLKDAGYNVLTSKQTAAELIEYISANISKSNKLLYLSGDHIASQLDTKLLAQGFNVVRKVVYSSVAVASLSETVLKDVDKILFYSPRTAKVFAELCQSDVSKVAAICISDNTASMLKLLNFKDILIAKYPTEEGMLSLLR